MHSPPASARQQRPFRVLLLNWRDTGHPDGGGSERMIEELASGLRHRGYDVRLQCAHYRGARRHDSLGGVPVARHGGRFSVYPHAMLHLLLHPHRYDLVVDVQNGVPFWSALVTKTRVLVLVHHVHRDVWPVVFGPKMARLGWFLESQIAPRVYARCRYVTVSTATRRELVELGVDEERITVIYNGSDPPPDLGELPVRTTQPSLVVLGRLVPHKRVERAIEAVAALRSEFPQLTLTVIGRGYWEPRLRARADELGVSDAVTFTGFVDDETKYRLLAGSWVHLLPSLQEGWGLSVIESAHCGTPTVAYRSAGGTTESIIDGATGLLLDDEENLADRLRELLRSPDMRRALGAGARRYARHFSWDQSIDRFEQLMSLGLREPYAPPLLTLSPVPAAIADQPALPATGTAAG